MELYDWQKSCVEEWIHNNTHGIADVITGAGKTVMALACAEYLRNQYSDHLRVCIVVPTIPLARQWKKAILEYFPEIKEMQSVGLYYGEQKDRHDHPFMIYVINSARYTLSRHILNHMQNGNHVLLICDECHRYTGEGNSLIFRFQNTKGYNPSLYHSLGLSATPQCEKFESVLIPALGKLFFQYGASEASIDQIISPFHIIHVSIPLNGEELDTYGKLTARLHKLIQILKRDNPQYRKLSQPEFFTLLYAVAGEDPDSIEASIEKTIRTRRTLLANAEGRSKCLIDLSERLASDDNEKFLIFSERIEQSEVLYEQLKKAFPGRVGHYHSEMTAEMRKHCLSMFREGEYRFLVTCRALDEGLDVPDATTAIVVSSGSMKRQRIQRLGRILRKSISKQCAKLYYFYVPHTIERRDYLDDMDAVSEITDIKYFPYNHAFISESYENAVVQTLEESTDTDFREKMMHCMEYGVVRTDWLLSADKFSTIIKESESHEIRNYYYCMMQIAKNRNRKL